MAIIICLNIANPFGGFVGQHGKDCARCHQPGEGGPATHHAQYGISREHPNGNGCMNICDRCAAKDSKKPDCQVTKGVITNA